MYKSVARQRHNRTLTDTLVPPLPPQQQGLESAQMSPGGKKNKYNKTVLDKGTDVSLHGIYKSEDIVSADEVISRCQKHTHTPAAIISPSYLPSPGKKHLKKLDWAHQGPVLSCTLSLPRANET